MHRTHVLYLESTALTSETIDGDRRPVVADLFAGAGGLTQGFTTAGFRSVAAVEFDRFAAQTYAANFGDHVLASPIDAVSVVRRGDRIAWRGIGLDGKPREIETPQIDVLVGGPPCQGFSPLGRMNDPLFDDPRNKLWKHYVRILDVLRPQIFVIENVPELLKSAEFDALKRHVRRLGHGYAVDPPF